MTLQQEPEVPVVPLAVKFLSPGLTPYQGSLLVPLLSSPVGWSWEGEDR